MSLPQLIDRAASVAAVLAELDVHRNELVLIMLADGPGFVGSFAGAVDRGALPLPVSPLPSVPELAAAAEAARSRLVLASPDQLSTLTEFERRASDTDQWTTRAVGSRAATAMSIVRGHRC